MALQAAAYNLHKRRDPDDSGQEKWGAENQTAYQPMSLPPGLRAQFKFTTVGSAYDMHAEGGMVTPMMCPATRVFAITG